MSRLLLRPLLVVLAATVLPACFIQIGGDPSPGYSDGYSDSYRGSDRREVQAEPFVWRGNVAPGQTLEIKGVNGPVNALPAEGGQAEVRATRTGKRSNPAQVQIQLVEYGGGATLCAVYPSSGGGANRCAPGDAGQIGARNNDVRVEWTVRVPRGVRFVARTTNGDVSTDGVADVVQAFSTNGNVRVAGASDAEVRTTNGNVTLAALQSASASTTNGSINATLLRPGRAEPLTFSTTNGSITLVVPDGTDARVEASTTNGRITTDFPLTVQGTVSARRISAKLGQGGRQLTLRTTNGSIRLRRGEGS